MARIDDIKNRQGETVYPRTLMDAVYEQGTNVVLPELMARNKLEQEKQFEDYRNQHDAEMQNYKANLAKGLDFNTETIVLEGPDPVIDLTLGSTFKYEITDFTKFTINERIDNGVQRFELIVSLPLGRQSIIFPSNIFWDNGKVPTLDYYKTPFTLSFTKPEHEDKWFGKVSNRPSVTLPEGLVLLVDSMLTDGVYSGNHKKLMLPPNFDNGGTRIASRMFEGKGIEFVASKNNELTDMSYMFQSGSSKLLILSDFDTSRVVNMQYMFYINKAKELIIPNFNTSNVTDMSVMFAASEATTLDLSSFDTSRVTDMNRMFSDSKATTLDLSSFDTSRVTDMSDMFSRSQSVEINLLNFETGNVTRMDNMFSGAKAKKINLTNFDTRKVRFMYGMFERSEAKELDLSSFNTSNVTLMRDMFADSKATTLDLSSFDTSRVTDMDRMFRGAKATVGYAKTQSDANKFNSSSGKPAGLNFIVKP